jgi:hypothetical protein
MMRFKRKKYKIFLLRKYKKSPILKKRCHNSYLLFSLSHRMLVGLRWWIEMDLDGGDQWVFECRVNQKNKSKSDERIFWVSQGLSAISLIILLIASLITLQIMLSSLMLFSAG